MGGVQNGQNIDYVIYEWSLGKYQPYLRGSYDPISRNSDTNCKAMVKNWHSMKWLSPKNLNQFQNYWIP